MNGGSGGLGGGDGGPLQSAPDQPSVQLQTKKVTTLPSCIMASPSDEVDENELLAGSERCAAHLPGVEEWTPHLKRASGGNGGRGGGGGGGCGGLGGGLGG